MATENCTLLGRASRAERNHPGARRVKPHAAPPLRLRPSVTRRPPRWDGGLRPLAALPARRLTARTTTEVHTDPALYRSTTATAPVPIEREEQQASTETNEWGEERTDQAGNDRGHERDGSERRIGERAVRTTDTGERVTHGNTNPVTAADHRNQRARATSITPAHLPANPKKSGC